MLVISYGQLDPCPLGYVIVRFQAVSSLDGLQPVRKHLQTIQILQRLLKSMQKPSLRFVLESILTKLRVN